jgi:glucose 1-dehydrogenase
MRAVVVSPPTAGAHLADVPTPEPKEGEVAVRVLECGVCGTDRDIAQGLYGTPPKGATQLVLGHENLGVIDAVGPGVEGWSPGELVVATVRRGCGICRFCLTNQSDFCETGLFTERGIRERDGYFAERYVEVPEYLVRIPPRLRRVAVLLEPMSVVEKAVFEGQQVLARRGRTPGHPPTAPARALVAGTGAIGMLAAFLLRSEGYEVTAIDRHGSDTAAGTLLQRIGATHVNASAGTSALGGQRFEIVVEATGNPGLDFDLIGTLGPNAALVLTGIPAAGRGPTSVDAGSMLRNLVLANQAIVGSVNANHRYFERGRRHFARFRRLWGDALAQLITERAPLDQAERLLSQPSGGTMKSVLVVGGR